MIIIRRLRVKRGVDTLLDIQKLEITPGIPVGIAGRHGSGKTLFLKVMSGLIVPDEGEIVFSEDNYKIGMLFQNHALFDDMTVFENVAFPLRAIKETEKKIKKRVEDELRLVGLSDARDLYPYQLSGGMKRRVGLARAMIHDPNILLCDDPTHGLDPVNTSRMMELILSRLTKNRYLIVVSNDLDVLIRYMKRVIFLYEGRILYDGNSTSFQENIRKDGVSQF